MCSQEDDPSMIDEPVTMDNAPVIRLVVLDDEHREKILTCTNPNCACKGPSFRNPAARTIDESGD